MLYCGERIGDGSNGPQVDIAVDPLDGTSLTAQARILELGTHFPAHLCNELSLVAHSIDARNMVTAWVAR